MSAWITDTADVEADRIKVELGKASCISLAADEWSKNNMKVYGVIAYHIDDDFQLKVFVAAFYLTEFLISLLHFHFSTGTSDWLQGPKGPSS